MPGEKAKDEVAQECARLQQEMIQASGCSSTGGNTESDANPQSISVSSRKKYTTITLKPAPNTSTIPTLGMRKCSSQGSTEGEKGEGEVESGAGRLQTFVQDPDCQQDRVSSHSKDQAKSLEFLLPHLT